MKRLSNALEAVEGDGGGAAPAPPLVTKCHAS
jgi:hypothetical protein